MPSELWMFILMYSHCCCFLGMASATKLLNALVREEISSNIYSKFSYFSAICLVWLLYSYFLWTTSVFISNSHLSSNLILLLKLTGLPGYMHADFGNGIQRWILLFGETPFNVLILLRSYISRENQVNPPFLSVWAPLEGMIKFLSSFFHV